jgi:hypothetical protein
MPTPPKVLVLGTNPIFHCSAESRQPEGFGFSNCKRYDPYPFHILNDRISLGIQRLATLWFKSPFRWMDLLPLALHFADA